MLTYSSDTSLVIRKDVQSISKGLEDLRVTLEQSEAGMFHCLNVSLDSALVLRMCMQNLRHSVRNWLLSKFSLGYRHATSCSNRKTICPSCKALGAIGSWIRSNISGGGQEI